EKLGKSEAEISKWLSGTHNFTIRTLSKIEAELGESVITTPKKVVEDIFNAIDKVASNFNNKNLKLNVPMAAEKEVTGELKTQTTKKECKVLQLWKKTQFVESKASQNKKEELTGTFC
ncbi:MAG: helix-turn-helix transcriptional regulator, partial [Bacteroidia bacterium]|nr:helix-turn-helix transcriptional regulator [Bacteroidia bacterium]